VVFALIQHISVFICLLEGVCDIMPAEICSEVRGAILAYIQNNHSCRKIAELLIEMGMTVSHTTVAKVKKQAEAERPGVMKKPKKVGT
jgi:hypothetical protein